MTSKRPRALEDWLRDIVRWGEQVAIYVDGIDLEAFLDDRLRRDAVVRCIECVGEAARHVLEDASNSGVAHLELYQAYWTRNRLAHGYYDLNMERVWETATKSLPKLASETRRALEQPKR